MNHDASLQKLIRFFETINPATIEQLTKLMERCEMARFAPSSELNPETDYKEAAQLIGELNKQL